MMISQRDVWAVALLGMALIGAGVMTYGHQVSGALFSFGVAYLVPAVIYEGWAFVRGT